MCGVTASWLAVLDDDALTETGELVQLLATPYSSSHEVHEPDLAFDVRR